MIEPGSLLRTDPPLPADDFAPALWVPLARMLRARRRLLTMAERLPASIWETPSRAPAWRRRDVLAHLAACDRRYHDALVATLNGAPLHEWDPHPARPTPALHRANQMGVERYADATVADLLTALRDGSEKTLQLLSALSEDDLLQPMGFAANAMSLLEAGVEHDNDHADDIINGPTMMRTL